jgi:hypothetical protein
MEDLLHGTASWQPIRAPKVAPLGGGGGDQAVYNKDLALAQWSWNEFAVEGMKVTYYSLVNTPPPNHRCDSPPTLCISITLHERKAFSPKDLVFMGGC